MDVKAKIITLIGALLLFNIGIWVYAYGTFYADPKFLALCVLAYGFGLRHAVDADHIAAIDNVTRKFVQQQKHPVSIGFFFSVGHSTIVVLLSIAVAIGTTYIQTHMDGFKNYGALIGTAVSSLFLVVLGIINLIIFIETFKQFRHFNAHARSDMDSEALKEALEKNGVMNRLFRPLFAFVSKPWHMYVVGFLFGLGFDTATEVALLGISATQASQGIAVWAIMVFPLLFMAGMVLIDTLDGVVMLRVYRYAFIDPLKKLYYNMVITFISFVIAFFIGGLEALGIIAEKLQLNSAFWAIVNALNDSMDNMGFYIIGFFIAAWLFSTLLYNRLYAKPA